MYGLQKAALLKTLYELIQLFLIMALVPATQLAAQSRYEKEILNLSLDRFRWKTEGKINPVEALADY